MHPRWIRCSSSHVDLYLELPIFCILISVSLVILPSFKMSMMRWSGFLTLWVFNWFLWSIFFITVFLVIRVSFIIITLMIVWATGGTHIIVRVILIIRTWSWPFMSILPLSGLFFIMIRVFFCVIMTWRIHWIIVILRCMLACMPCSSFSRWFLVSILRSWRRWLGEKFTFTAIFLYLFLFRSKFYFFNLIVRVISLFLMRFEELHLVSITCSSWLRLW